MYVEKISIDVHERRKISVIVDEGVTMLPNTLRMRACSECSKR